jgi:hypothetical protein
MAEDLKASRDHFYRQARGNDDTKLLDYLQKTGATVHLVPDSEDPGNAMAYKFCVGGWASSVNRDLRASIRAAMKA